ncbi:MAG: N-methyl-L-tryptophan oxidase [Burkholderiales bacterium]|nr:N-methyl-L-tryptophan oxidase [Burkholderiales bacterium]
MDRVTADAIVVGLGAVGSAVCHHLSRSGAKVVGIDRFRPPHDLGSSHGLTRITRLAVGEGAAFVPLALRSHELWRELEAASGESLYRRTGGLIVASEAAGPNAFHGQAGFFGQTIALAQRFGIAHELLDAAAIRDRFPAFLAAEGDRGYLEADAGVLFPERIVAAQLQQAERHGAVLRLGERVLGVEPQGAAVTVRTDRGQLSAARVIVAAGAWMPALGGAGFGAGLRVLRQALLWFRADEPALFAPERCPVFIWLHASGAAGSMYGFPMIDGVAGVKVASEQDTLECEPDRVERTVGDAEASAVFEQHLRGRLRGVTPQVVRTATCLYTSTADAAFRIRPHPDSDAITLVSACSGHGFKHSAALGEALAQRALGQAPQLALDAFTGPR